MAFSSLDCNVHVHEKIFREICTANAILARIAISLLLTLRLFEIHIVSRDLKRWNLAYRSLVDYTLKAESVRNIFLSKIAGPAKPRPVIGLFHEREICLGITEVPYSRDTSYTTRYQYIVIYFAPVMYFIENVTFV